MRWFHGSSHAWLAAALVAAAGLLAAPVGAVETDGDAHAVVASWPSREGYTARDLAIRLLARRSEQPGSE